MEKKTTSTDASPVNANRTIRSIAICVFRHGDQILVVRDTKPGTADLFFRPFGGGIEFGELAADAIVREIAEELGEAIEAPKLLGVLESRFRLGGRDHHEHVFVFDAVFRNRELYDRARILGKEGCGAELRGEWLRTSTCASDSIPLYPEGLLALLQATV